MKRFLSAALVLTLAACGSSPTDAPRNLDNACSILEQRPGYLRAFQSAEKKWGVPVHVQMAAMYQESKFKSEARPPHRYSLGVIPIGRQSSAFGYSQALDGTWKEYKQQQRKPSAKRNKIRDATDFMGWYMAQTNRELGISLSDARNQYLAYHDGRTGYRRGTYRKKPWLMRISGEIAARSDRYRSQLATCRVRR